MDWDVGRVVAGKYRLERVVGRGGMGDVWQARHETLGKPVAVKVLRTGAGEDEATARARFDLEAKVSAHLSRRSRHVVSVIDQGEEDGAPFLVMELLEGESLADVLERSGILPLPKVHAIVAQVARALVCAHSEGVVHRDLTPSNVFLTHDDEARMLVKVVDFGVARVLDPRVGERAERRTKRGVVVGTPSYMSPEQARGARNVGAECDVWACAAIAYEALAGRPPFASDGSNAMGGIDALLAGRFAPPSTVRADLPVDVDVVFRRAFDLDPDKRYPNAAAFADALARAIGESAADPAPPMRARRSAVWLLVPLVAVVAVGWAIAAGARHGGASAEGARVPSGGAEGQAACSGRCGAGSTSAASNEASGPVRAPQASPAHPSVGGAPATAPVLVKPAATGSGKPAPAPSAAPSADRSAVF